VASLPHPCDPELHDSYLDYVRLAENLNGPIPRGVNPSYIWGAALDELRRLHPDPRIINLETSITRNEAYEQQRFARELIDRAGVSIVHGHSSHHAKAIEVHNGRLIL
jgi:poly-gamma-glutamate capsule biosynthesis protein CapA/YwtB (metallophosphatase superfamily)